jgi:quercetin dioxygenase-like cupin family protein
MISTEFSPANEAVLQQVSGLSASVCRLKMGQETSWRAHSSTTLIVLCTAGVLRVEIDQPMYSVDLAPGELYAVPANLAYRLAAREDAAGFLLIRSGNSEDQRETSVRQQDREEFLRTVPSAAPPVFNGVVDRNFERFKPGYTRVDVLAKAERLRFLILGLGAYRCVPWHTHDEVTDTFFCIDGPMRVETSQPDHTHVLLPGQTCEVPAGRPHFVSGTEGNPCTFLVMQGIGHYNYVPVDHV